LSVVKYWKAGFEDQKQERFRPDGSKKYEAIWMLGRKLEERKYNKKGFLKYECLWFQNGGIRYEHPPTVTEKVTDKRKKKNKA
jgi:hypothetical protein